MNRNSLLLAVILACVPVVSNALPASRSNQGRTIMRTKALYGSWKSTDLSGDGIWLVVDSIGVDFGQHGTFKATAVMSDGSNKTYKGDYYIDLGKIRLVPDEMQDVICYYSLKNGTLTLKPSKHDITIKLKRGQLDGQKKTEAFGMHF